MQKRLFTTLKRPSWCRNNSVYLRFTTPIYFQNHLKFSTLPNNIDVHNLPLSQVVKIHCTRNPPDRSQQWQNKAQRHSTGSGFIISEKKILTNAHVVADQTFVTITKHNSGTHFPARVVTVGHECDIAMLEIEDKSFFDTISDDKYFEFGDIPQLQDTVTVLGYPTGGDAISVTRGVVSRVEVVSYTHAAHYLLAIQIDAAINSGNSGGPAIMDGKVIGIAFQNMPDAENVGYIIPTPIINHFLGDIFRFGEYRGFCFIGIAYQSLLDTMAMHRFFGLDYNKTGILVTNVFDYSVSKGIIKEHDIITHIDGHEIYNDGSTKFRQNETIAMEHLIASKYDQETIDITVWRDQKEVQLKNIKLSILPQHQKKSHLVPIHQYDMQSCYYIFGGCIFTVLTQPYLHTWGDDWYHIAPRDLITEAMKGELSCDKDENDENDKDKGHGIEEIIVMSCVRPHHTNMGSNRFCNIILEKVGNINIKSLKHLKEVIENEFILNWNDKKLIDFRFRRNALMVLDIKSSVLSENEILHRNRIPYRQSMDLDEFDNGDVQEMFNRINNEANEEEEQHVEIYYDSEEISGNVDDSVAHDIQGEDHSKLLSDCFKEQTNVEMEKYKSKKT